MISELVIKLSLSEEDKIINLQKCEFLSRHISTSLFYLNSEIFSAIFLIINIGFKILRLSQK